MDTEPNSRERIAATQYDLLEAIDEAMAEDFRDAERRVDTVQLALYAWLDVPAFTRVGNTTRSAELMTELDQCRDALFDLRKWTWTRRVAGYSAGHLFIGEA